MKKYKICFIGLGSIAKRHILNIYEISKERGTDVEFDVIRHDKTVPCDKSISKLIKNIYSVNDDIPDDYDIIFITNPTKKHYETLKKYNRNAKSFFIEKPVFDTPNINYEDLNLVPEKVYYVACPLRYKKAIKYIKENIDIKDVLSIRCISSSYLPDWRPGIDYRKTYSAVKELGGGVAIDLIHEWDYLHYICGRPENIFSIFSKTSDLEIDTEDIAVYIAKYPSFLVELHLDYFGRSTRREIELFTKEDTITCDLIKNEIRWMKSGRVISFEEERDDFQKEEMRAFFDMITNEKENINSIEFAIETLKLTGGYVNVV